MSSTSIFAAKNTALITGDASWIGLAVAQLCRKHGMCVAIADWNVDYLSKAESTLLEDKRPEDVKTYQIDVSKTNELEGVREQACAEVWSYTGFSDVECWDRSKR